MPFDIGNAAWEIGKIAGGAIVGFFIGRYQTKAANHAARVREGQKSTVELIRAAMDDAADHFSKKLEPDERIASSAVLKVRIKRVSTESAHLAEMLGLRSDTYLSEHSKFHDAITRYPFETFGAANFVVDRGRVAEVSVACEAYVAKIYKDCR